MTQAFGRPVQEVELGGAAGGAIQIVVESCFSIEDGENPAPPALPAPQPVQLTQGETEHAGAQTWSTGETDSPPGASG